MTQLILDATCGSRSIWFDKRNPLTLFVDRRREHHEAVFGVSQPARRTLDIAPDVIADFTDLPFPDETFWHVVFDPPHFVDAKATQWYCKAYGTLSAVNWREVLTRGFAECWRVLKTNGTLIFKWAEVSIPTRDLFPCFPASPLYGHRSGKKSGTHWLAFFKPPQMQGAYIQDDMFGRASNERAL